MASRLNPYLNFEGDARRAMEFYQEVFGGTLSLNTYGELGGQSGTADADMIMHGMLETPSGFTLMGADTPGEDFNRGNAYSIALTDDDEAELRGYWEKLSASGSVSVPLEKQMWGDVFGMCTDRFGVAWMVNISGQQG
ncbi:VOC family protein [Streptomyces gossypiisoli]|uniref:VOC family protein n=1 Tax=Streptomyces gossypiisoli TaxID=2748864 RepID=UPI0015DB1FCD|nr:VOC family protein [Streptomyces gossypiisoli]